MFSASHFFSGKYFSKHQQVCESKKKDLSDAAFTSECYCTGKQEIHSMVALGIMHVYALLQHESY